MRNLKIYLLSFFSCLLLQSCDKDDKVPDCIATNVSMIVNGELQTFQALGRGIDLTNDGYVLSLNLDRRNNEILLREQTFYIQLPYKKTGKNIIKNCDYHQYVNGISLDGDLVNSDFQSDVIINRNTCFYATFSAKLKDGNKEVIITDGKISYTYENPFED